jgi:hypothetical protein
MADNFNNLRIDPNIYLGLSYSKFRNEIFKQALVNPSGYYDLRSKCEKELQTEAIKNLYDVIYFTLSKGTTGDGTGDLGFPCEPCVPIQKINEIALSACETLNQILQDEILELLLPLDYNKLMESRLRAKGEAKTLGDLTSANP